MFCQFSCVRSSGPCQWYRSTPGIIHSLHFLQGFPSSPQSCTFLLWVSGYACWGGHHFCYFAFEATKQQSLQTHSHLITLISAAQFLYPTLLPYTKTKQSDKQTNKKKLKFSHLSDVISSLTLWLSSLLVKGLFPMESLNLLSLN